MRQKSLYLAALAAILTLPLIAQEPSEDTTPRPQINGMQRAAGEVTAISGSHLTIKAEDGTIFQVITTDNTRLMKGRGITVKVGEIKVGDGVMAVGNMDVPNKTLHAAMVFATDAAEVRKLREAMGKTYIVGKVTAIDADNAKMTLQRPDGVSQTIGFDETTSFRRGRMGRNSGFGGGMSGGIVAIPGDAPSAGGAPSVESITLADIKVGDTVGGQGAVKSGVFVPTVLTVATPGQGRRRPATGRTRRPQRSRISLFCG